MCDCYSYGGGYGGGYGYGYGGYGYGGYGYGGYGYGGYGYSGYGYDCGGYSGYGGSGYGGYGYGYSGGSGYGYGGDYGLGIGGDGTNPQNIAQRSEVDGGDNIFGNDTSGRATDSARQWQSSGYDTPRENGSVHSGQDYVPLNADGSVNSSAHALSISQGTVVSVGAATGFGNNTVVVQNAGTGNYVLYGHMSAASVTVGSTVNVGDRIGTIGNQGVSSGIHLHVQESMGSPFHNGSNFAGFVDPGYHDQANHTHDVVAPFPPFDKGSQCTSP